MSVSVQRYRRSATRARQSEARKGDRLLQRLVSQPSRSRCHAHNLAQCRDSDWPATLTVNHSVAVRANRDQGVWAAPPLPALRQGRHVMQFNKILAPWTVDGSKRKPASNATQRPQAAAPVQPRGRAERSAAFARQMPLPGGRPFGCSGQVRQIARIFGCGRSLLAYLTVNQSEVPKRVHAWRLERLRSPPSRDTEAVSTFEPQVRHYRRQVDDRRPIPDR